MSSSETVCWAIVTTSNQFTFPTLFPLQRSRRNFLKTFQLDHVIPLLQASHCSQVNCRHFCSSDGASIIPITVSLPLLLPLPKFSQVSWFLSLSFSVTSLNNPSQPIYRRSLLSPRTLFITGLRLFSLRGLFLSKIIPLIDLIIVSISHLPPVEWKVHNSRIFCFSK